MERTIAYPPTRNPTDEHLDLHFRSLRFFAPVEDPQHKFGVPGAENKTFPRGFGFQMMTRASVQRTTPPGQGVPAHCFFTKDPDEDWHPASLPDSQRILQRLVSLRDAQEPDSQAKKIVSEMVQAGESDLRRRESEQKQQVDRQLK